MSKEKTGLKTLYAIGFLFGVALAFPAYVQSSFLSQFVSVSEISWFFAAAMLVTLIAINFFPHYIKKFTNYKIALILLTIFSICSIILATTFSLVLAFIVFCLWTACFNLIFINMDIFIERLTAKTSMGHVRTAYISCYSLGLVISPFLGGYLVGDGNYSLVYLVTAVLAIFILLIFLVNGRIFQTPVAYEHHNSWRSIKKVFNNLNLRRVYLVQFLLQFFFAATVVYIPVYLNQTLGIAWPQVGLILTVMLLPYLFLIPFGNLADLRWGEKEMMTIGIIIMSLASFLMFMVSSTSILVWAGILFFSRIGSALTEGMADTYFFKKVDVKDLDYINIFRNSLPLGYIAGATVAALILWALPLQYLFLFLGIILISGVYFSLRLKDTR